jgi:uncharacterized protein YecE (DUF72 family)
MKRAQSWSRSGTPVFVYFDNDRDGAAPHDAVRLFARLQGRRARPADLIPALEPESPAPRERPSHFAFPRRAR